MSDSKPCPDCSQTIQPATLAPFKEFQVSDALEQVSRKGGLQAFAASVASSNMTLQKLLDTADRNGGSVSHSKKVALLVEDC